MIFAFATPRIIVTNRVSDSIEKNIMERKMGNAATIIKFQPRVQPKKSSPKQKKITNLDGIKYFTRQQIQLLRRTVRDMAMVHASKNNITAIREWMAIDLLTSTGMRVSEASDFRCGDIRAGYGQSAVFVRNGKGGKSRTVEVPESLKKHLKSFLSWKAKIGENVGDDDYLLVGQRGPWTAQAIQQVVKKYLKQLGLYEPGKSVHSLRHSFAVEVYKAEKDLLAVKKLLGHSSIQTTMIYAQVLPEDLQRQVKGLWGA
jgi:integrase/recombinase XerD